MRMSSGAHPAATAAAARRSSASVLPERAGPTILAVRPSKAGDFCHHVSHECLLIGQDAAGRVEIARGAIGVDDRPLIEGEGEIGIGQGVLLLDVLA